MPEDINTVLNIYNFSKMIDIMLTVLSTHTHTIIVIKIKNKERMGESFWK